MLAYYCYTHPTSGCLRLIAVDSDHLARQGRVTVHDSTGSHVVKSCNLASISLESARLVFRGRWTTTFQFDVTGYNLSEISPTTHPELFL